MSFPLVRSTDRLVGHLLARSLELRPTAATQAEDIRGSACMQVKITQELCSGKYKNINACKADWKKIKDKALPKKNKLDELVRAGHNVMKRPGFSCHSKPL